MRGVPGSLCWCQGTWAYRPTALPGYSRQTTCPLPWYTWALEGNQIKLRLGCPAEQGEVKWESDVRAGGEEDLGGAVPPGGDVVGEDLLLAAEGDRAGQSEVRHLHQALAVQQNVGGL